VSPLLVDEVHHILDGQQQQLEEQNRACGYERDYKFSGIG